MIAIKGKVKERERIKEGESKLPTGNSKKI